MMAIWKSVPRAAAVFVVMIGFGHLARAQPAGPKTDDRANSAEAARLYDEGKRHFDIGEYAQAIASWKLSYLRSSAPLLLFNIAQAYRLSTNCAQANRFYLNYRRIEKHPKNQAELEKAMAKCAGVEPATGDAAPTATPPATTGSPPAGAAGTPLVATTTGSPPTESPAPRSATLPVTTPTGQTARSPTTSLVHATPQPSNRGRGWRTAGLVTGSLGGAALVVGAAYAIKAKLDSNTVSGERTGTPFTGSVASTDRGGKTAATLAQGLLGIGAALAVAGGTMWYLGHRQGAAQLDVAIIPGHTEVTFSCVF